MLGCTPLMLVVRKAKGESLPSGLKEDLLHLEANGLFLKKKLILRKKNSFVNIDDQTSACSPFEITDPLTVHLAFCILERLPH